MKALLVVDIQNDFLSGGALGVPDSDRIIPLINRLMGRFDLVVASQDCHPRNHCSLASNHPGRRPGETVMIAGQPQVLWPDHCIEGSCGFQLADKLDKNRIKQIFRKGASSQYDSYSCFFDNGHVNSTGMADYLEDAGVKEVYIVGLAIDYCVKYSAIDAVNYGFDTYVIIDACRGINLVPGDLQQAITAMVAAGVKIITADMILDA